LRILPANPPANSPVLARIANKTRLELPLGLRYYSGMTPLTTYQFHQFLDVQGLMHVVKDSEIVQVKYHASDPAGQVVLANGQIISVVLANLQDLIGLFTFPQYQIQAAWTTDGTVHVLNKNRIDNVEWLGSAPNGVIILSNGDKITVAINPLIQIITVLTQTINS
jgi:uncharacterized protein YlzI (FlbEa/FlbD family)